MDVYMGTVMSFAFNYAPKNWALCSGQLLSVQSNQALFSLLGKLYGGDGVNTFALPDLRGRAIIGQGKDQQNATWVMGQQGGMPTTMLIASQMPMHTHTSSTTISLPAVADDAGTTDPTNANFAVTSGANAYTSAAANTSLKPFQENLVVAMAGNSLPFSNVSPYQVLTYAISVYGIYPSRN